jgi:predicted permease
MTPAEARLAAKRAYGGVDQAKELHRDERSFVWLEQALQDVRHAFRSLAKSPAFTLVALISLAFGIGVNTAIFTLVNGILLKTLPIAEPDRIVQVEARMPKSSSSAFSYPVFRALRQQRGVFQDVIGCSYRDAVLDLAGDTQRVKLQLVSGSYFSFLEGRPALGRLLQPEDDAVESASPVCVLSYSLWKNRFAGDPHALGRSVRIDGTALTVVGVATADFIGAELQRWIDVWVPTALAKSFTHNNRDDPNTVWIGALGRLQPGLSFDAANARLKVASLRIEAALPKERTNADSVYELVPAAKGFDSWGHELREPLVILMAAVSLVLLVACANLANLLLARANERRQEFAIRLSLGSSRARLLRQMLLETFLISLGGGILGILLSLWTTRFLLTFYTESGQNLHVSPDLTVLEFTLGVCTITTLLAGLYPAWRASCTNPSPGLQAKRASHGLVRRGLVFVQVALSVVLLFGASLFTHSLSKLKTVDLGYDIERVLTIDIGRQGNPSTEQSTVVPPALNALLDRVRQAPEIQSAAFSMPGILSGGMMVGVVNARDAQRGEADFLFASPGYFQTLGIGLLRGRDFQSADCCAKPVPAIVNQRLAAKIWPGVDPIGKHFDGWGEKNIEVVGLVANSKYGDVREHTTTIAYLPFARMAGSEGGALEIRFRGPASRVEAEVRQAVKSAAGYQVSNVSTMRLLRDSIIAQDRLLAFLSDLFGILGATLALAGIYGVVAYSVTSRTHEIGIRLSVGAQAVDILNLFLRETLLSVAAGVVVGILVALALARFIASMLYAVSTRDPAGITATLPLIALGSLLAAYVPGRRATRVDPVRALRHD